MNRLRTALRTLADTLSDRGISARWRSSGGVALLLSGGCGRPTQDVDVLRGIER